MGSKYAEHHYKVWSPDQDPAKQSIHLDKRVSRDWPGSLPRAPLSYLLTTYVQMMNEAWIEGLSSKGDSDDYRTYVFNLATAILRELARMLWT